MRDCIFRLLVAEGVSELFLHHDNLCLEFTHCDIRPCFICSGVCDRACGGVYSQELRVCFNALACFSEKIHSIATSFFVFAGRILPVFYFFGDNC